MTLHIYPKYPDIYLIVNIYIYIYIYIYFILYTVRRYRIINDNRIHRL